MPENEAYGMTNPAAWATQPINQPGMIAAPAAPSAPATPAPGAGVMPPGYGNDPQALMQMIMQTILGQNLARFFGGGQFAPSQFTPGGSNPIFQPGMIQATPGPAGNTFGTSSVGPGTSGGIGTLPAPPGFTPGEPIIHPGMIQAGPAPGPIGSLMGADPNMFGGLPPAGPPAPTPPGMDMILQLLAQMLGGQQAPQNQAPQGMNNAPYSWLSQFGQGMGQ